MLFLITKIILESFEDANSDVSYTDSDSQSK